MFIHNTTINIEESVLLESLSLIKTEYIQSLKKDDIFKQVIFSEVLANVQPQTRTYSLQVFCNDIQQLKNLTQNYLPKIEKLLSVYADKVLFFQTKMRRIE